MKLTSEQKAIVNEAVSLYEDGGGYVLVNAFAGTGKTTTMISVVDALRSAGAERVLYLAYNRKMADEAKRKLDGKAEARTVHSIAYQKVGEIIGYEKLSKWLNEGKAPHHYFRKDNLWPKVKAYVESDALYPEDDSVFSAIEKMKSDEVRMTHDVYAKAFACALNEVDILGIGLDCSDIAYDAVILDEAQDANPQILSIFKSIRGKVKVAVGDTHQQIYAFRGAVNALDILKEDTDTEPLYLTHSFRFANDTKMVEKANYILRSWKKEEKTLIGAGEPNETLPDAIISRTNSAIVARLLNLSDAEKKEIAVFGNVRDIIASLGVVADAVVGKKSKNGTPSYEKDYPVFSEFKAKNESFEAIKASLAKIRGALINGTISVTGEPADYAVACTILRKQEWLFENGNIPSEEIESRIDGVVFGKTTKDTKKVMLTAHASKGLEFYDVELIGFKATFFILMLKIYERLFKERVEKAVKAMRDMEGEVYADEIVDRLPSFEKVWEYILANSNEWAQVINEANLSYVAVTRASNSVRVVDKTPFFGGDAEYEWRKFLRWKINELIDSKT